ncbi:MAG: hypothetical protein IJI34_06105 [Clostridia bacterium]|nr:hypothetical protein [Clostridia bacterium]
MKKSLALLAALLLLFALGCGKEPAAAKDLSAEAATAEPTAAPTEEPTAAPTEEPTPEPQPTAVPEDYDLWKNAETELYEDLNGGHTIKITAAVPVGATLKVEIPGQENFEYTNTEDELTYRKVHIPIKTYFPNAPLDAPDADYTPHVTITTADGTECEIGCPSVHYTFPTLSIEVTSEGETGGDGSIRVKAGKQGVYTLTFTVSEADALVRLDDAELTADENGVFTRELSPVDGAPTTFVLTAEKNNRVTTTMIIVVEP